MTTLNNRLFFEKIKRTDYRLTSLMNIHYSKPKGFVGRSLCYAIWFDDIFYGCIVGGSATKNLPGRPKINNLNSIINNIFYHIERGIERYPTRNFTTMILKNWLPIVAQDWEKKYGDVVIAFESLVELPRTGDLYKKANFVEIGITKGYTCKREGGIGTDNWTGKRVWNTTNLKPKRVFWLELNGKII